MSTGPLTGWRVVEITDLRGALCGRILADLGADVVRVERPRDHGSGSQPTTAYRYRNANKRRISIDLHSVDGHETLSTWLSRADVLIENLGPRHHASHGVEPNELSVQHPHLVHVALTDFGLDGPRSRWHLEPLAALAASGTLHATGHPDLPPCWLPGHLAHDCASVYGALGAVAAVMDRRRNGGFGQVVEVSAQEAALAGTNPWSIALESYLHINPHLPIAGQRNADGAYWVLPALDGWVRVVIGNGKQWRGFVELCGSPDALTGDEWFTQGFRQMNGDLARAVAAECLTDRRRSDLFEQALKVGATIGVLHTPNEYVEHPQTMHRRFFAATGFPGLGDAPFAAVPLRMSATKPSLRRAAPRPDDVDAAMWPDRIAEPSTGRSRRSGEGPLLDGVRIVEFGVAAVVPEMCGALAELGADVIKIESVAHPDVLRLTGMGQLNCGFAFNVECRGRRSVTLDLSTEKGRALAFDLCASADIVAENHRGGVLEKLGLGEVAVRERNPSVIYVSSQGYGRGGPYGEMPAYGPLNSGFAGIHHLWSHPEAPYPCGTSLNHPDHIGGKLLAAAVLAALDHRDRTSEGQYIDMAQTEAAAYLLGEVYLDAALTGIEPGPRGNRVDNAVPHDVYPSAGDDQWIAIVVNDDEAWQRLEEALGWERDARLASLEGRLTARDEIDARLSAWTSQRTADEAAALLQANDVSAMPVMGPIDHHADPHLAAREFIVTLQHPEVGEEKHAGNPLRFSRIEQPIAPSAPCLGADTEEVLGEVLGITPAQVADLVERGICR